MRKRAEKIAAEIIEELDRHMETATGYILDASFEPYLISKLTAAVLEDRSKVPPPDEIHRDGYNEGVKEEREKWEGPAREAVGGIDAAIIILNECFPEDHREYRLNEVFVGDLKEISERLAALLTEENENPIDPSFLTASNEVDIP